MRARPAADILGRGPAADPTPLLFNPLSALIAVSRAFTCCAALSRSAFNCAIMSMCSSPGEDCNRRSATQEALLESAPAYNSPRVVSAMARALTWVSDQHLTGWTCSRCGWTFPLPSLLKDPEARKAYDRLASAKFQRHDCATHRPVVPLDLDSFINRTKGLVMRGFTPKDAAEIAAREITMIPTSPGRCRLK